MGLKYQISKAANALLYPLGARIEPLESPQEWQFIELKKRYNRNVLELYKWLLESHFQELPSTPGREELLYNLVGTNISEAVWLLDSLHHSMNTPGDVCEFGIAEGATSTLLANEIRGTNKKLWLFDSFEGLSVPTAEDELIDDIFDLGSMKAYAGKMKYDVSEVAGRLAAIDFQMHRVEIVPGFIEESLARSKLPTSVSCAYVDFDFYQPIQTALEFLDKVLCPGGSIVVDDYGFFSSGAKKAVDEFFETVKRKYQILLPPDCAGHFAVLRRSTTA
jgi:hypothetical protein